MKLQDIMTTNVETIAPTVSAEDAWQAMRSRRIHHLLVLHGGELIGVLSDRDLGGPNGASFRTGRRVNELMSTNVVTASSDATVKEAANLLRGRSIGCLPIRDEDNFYGVITVSDLLELIGRGAEKPVARSKRWTLKHRGRGRAGSRGGPSQP